MWASSMHGLLLIAFLAVANAQTCGMSPIMKRSAVVPMIVGGVEARPSSHPWVVSIQSYGSHFCGGSLIRVGAQEKTDIVLTAAHCLAYGTNGITVLAGAHDLEYPKASWQRVQAASFVIHEQYNEAKSLNDIAIIKLAKPINFTSTVGPVCLPTQGQTVNANTEAIVAGWGLRREGAGNTSPILMQVGVPVVAHATCASNYVNDGITIVSNQMLCAGYPNGEKDSCQGDSGGPLVIKNNNAYTLQGIVSFGTGCARAGKPGVYARVSNYRNWINNKVAANSAIAG